MMVIKKLKSLNKYKNNYDQWFWWNTIMFHHTSHFFNGFIGDPAGHLKSLENSLEFENGPCTRNCPGECAPVRILISKLFGRYFEHQVLAAPTQNNWLGVRSSPGSADSFPCRCVQRSMNIKYHLMFMRFLHIIKYPNPYIMVASFILTIRSICFLQPSIVCNIFSLCIYSIQW